MNKMLKNSSKLALLRSAGILFACLLSAHNAHSDITADSTVGTTVNLSGSDYTLGGGTQVGTNLFQSFGVFDVHTGETATFQGDVSVTRILGRVTGGTASSIDGTLSSSISGADLYLINPAGVVFGANAALDVSGSFYVSTADYVNLGTDGRFDVGTPGSSVLSSSAPSAFGFVSSIPAAISFNGSFLRVADNATLSVIGGDININDTHLYAKQGRIDIASAGSPGEVVPTANGMDMNGFTRQGNISVSQSTNILGRPLDGPYRLANIDTSGDGGGAIFIRGGRFVSDNGSVFSDTRGSGAGGEVDVRVEDELRLTNEGRITADTIIGGGPGGDIMVSAKTVVLESGGTIGASTFGPGSGGTVTINASEQVSISGRSAIDDSRLFGNQQSQISSAAFDTGQGGVVTIMADSVSLNDEGLINVFSLWQGDAGSVLINAGDVNISGGAAVISDTWGEGGGGAIVINASGSLSVSGTSIPSDPSESPSESQISAIALGRGSGGSISITAAELVVADRGVIKANLSDNPTTGQASPTVDTRAGNITITADTLSLTGGGQVISGIESVGYGGKVLADVTGLTRISGSSVDGTQSSGLYSVALGAGESGSVQLTTGQLQMDGLSTINTSTIGAGNAGQLLIQADTVELKSGARISSSTSGAGAGGTVTVATTGAITATGVGSDGFGSGFYSDVQVPSGGQASDASGNGGNIKLTAAAIKLNEQATISAKSNGVGNAGSIDINAGAKLELFNGASIITESSNSGGGRINIIARDLLHLKNSKITSSVADGAGNGGDITIDPEFVILDSSQILANADAGSGGNINITTNFFIASPDSIVDASANTGIDGEVNIDSPTTDIIGAVEDLPESFLNVAALLKQRCAVRAGGTSSSFVVTGTGGVPASPDGLLYTSDIPLSGSAQNGAIPPSPQNLKKESSIFIRNSDAGKIAVMLGCGT